VKLPSTKKTTGKSRR